MLLEFKRLNSFKKDYKYLSKKHYNFDTLLRVLEILQNQQQLSNKYKNHYLKGNFKGLQECHIDNNMILLYKVEDNILVLIKLGTHKDVLSK